MMIQLLPIAVMILILFSALLAASETAIFSLTRLEVSVEDNDHFTPAGSGFARLQHMSVRHGVNWIAQIAVFAADAIQVVAFELF